MTLYDGRHPKWTREVLLPHLLMHKESLASIKHVAVFDNKQQSYAQLLSADFGLEKLFVLGTDSSVVAKSSENGKTLWSVPVPHPALNLLAPFRTKERGMEVLVVSQSTERATVQLLSTKDGSVQEEQSLPVLRYATVISTPEADHVLSINKDSEVALYPEASVDLAKHTFHLVRHCGLLRC
ncbi:MAG TPA: hypothetical protein V6D20_08495 [Candidatus Obscuribacterales bacterium]